MKNRVIGSSLKDVLQRIPIYTAVRRYRERRRYREWLHAGKPAPPPSLVKQQTVKEFAKHFGVPVFVETGTYLGDMVDAVENCFEEIYSVELGEELYRAAARRFRKSPKVTILLGDSGQVLSQLLPRIQKPCLFWLDGHYSAGITAKGELETPIQRELAHIAQHPLRQSHVILIDDAHCFNGQGDYPNIDTLKIWAHTNNFAHFDVQADIVRVFNPKKALAGTTALSL